jgi:hypothetical protein
MCLHVLACDGLYLYIWVMILTGIEKFSIQGWLKLLQLYLYSMYTYITPLQILNPFLLIKRQAITHMR